MILASNSQRRQEILKDAGFNFKVITSNIEETSDKKIIDCNILKGDLFITPTSEILDEIGQSAVALRRKYLVYHHLFVLGATDFHQYFLSTNRHAYCHDGNDVAYGFLYRLYVSYREHASCLSGYIQDLPLKLLL